MFGMNSLCLSGYVMKNSMRPKANGVFEFALQVPMSKKNPDGTWKRNSYAYNCVCFGMVAEHLNKNLKEGIWIDVQGRIDLSGEEKGTVYHKCVVERFYYPKQESGEQYAASSQPKTAKVDEITGEVAIDDEVPF